jgi:hypothetical protein
MLQSTRLSVALFALGSATSVENRRGPWAAYELGKQGLTDVDQRQVPIRKLTIEPGGAAGFLSQWV